MRPLRVVPALLAGVLVLVAASPASAVTFKLPPFLFAKMGTIKHYAVSFTGGNQSASVAFVRTRGKATQVHTMSALGAGAVRYSATASLSKASLSTSLGSRGKIKIAFHATGRAHKQLPKGCTGRADTVRTGVITGTIRVKMDRHFFKTVTRKRLPAILAKSGNFFCGGGGGFGGRTRLGLTVPSPAAATLGGLFERLGTSSALENVSYLQTGPHWEIAHTINETVARSSLTATKNLATVTARGRGPWLAGTLRFRGTGPIGSANRAGSIGTSSFVATFDSIGRKRFRTGTAASALQG